MEDDKINYTEKFVKIIVIVVVTFIIVWLLSILFVKVRYGKNLERINSTLTI